MSECCASSCDKVPDFLCTVITTEDGTRAWRTGRGRGGQDEAGWIRAWRQGQKGGGWDGSGDTKVSALLQWRSGNRRRGSFSKAQRSRVDARTRVVLVDRGDGVGVVDVGAVDAVLSRMGVVVAGVCVGDVARDGPEHGDVMGEERGGVRLSTSRFMVKKLPPELAKYSVSVFRMYTTVLVVHTTKP